MNKPFIFAAIFLVGIAGCSRSITIQTDHVNQIDLNRYKTFKFEENESKYNLAFNEATEERIKIAVAAELAERNYIESDLADFHVKILGNIDIVRQTGERRQYYGFYPYYDPYYAARGPRSENQNALIINVIDAATQKLVWQGVATGEFRQKKKHIEAVIAETVRSIFSEFPYAAE